MTGALLGSAAIGAGATLASGAMNSAMGYLANYRSYKYAKKLAKYNYNLERESRQTSYGDTRKSLEDAGYNPMLAVNQQSQGLTPSSTGINASSSEIDIAGAINSAMALRDQVKRNDTLNTVDLQNAENNAISTMQNSALTKAQTENQLIKNDVDKVTALDTAYAQLDDITAHSAKQRQEIRNLKQDVQESQSRIIKNLSDVDVNKANVLNVNSATTGQNLRNQSEQDYIKWLNDYGDGDKYKRTKTGIKNTGYASRALGFNPLSVGAKATAGVAIMKGRR